MSNHGAPTLALLELACHTLEHSCSQIRYFSLQSKLLPLLDSYAACKENLESVLDYYAERLRACEERDGKSRLKQQTVRVLGPLYGAWGIAKYGKKPKKVWQPWLWRMDF